MKSLFSLFIAVLFIQAASTQELLAKFSVVSSKVGSGVDKKIFQTLQTAVTNFLNNRKWTGDNFQPQEKIKCSFLFTVDEYSGNNVFKGSLTVQAARPIYNTAYESPIINMQDPSVQFKYVEFQPLEFNENRIQGSDPLTSNLTAILAYYVNIILGMDYDSFSPRGGDPYFQKADYIVNNAPEGGDIIGWKTFEGLRNRQKLIQGFTDPRFNLVHDAIYSYYRGGFDKFYENETEGRASVLNALNHLNTVNSENPGSMVIQFFFQGKSNELVKLFTKAEPDIKSRARDFLVKMDLTNASAYKELK
ncbi:MAG: type IX secretion system protein PorD [Flavisolibacter sp.]